MFQDQQDVEPGTILLGKIMVTHLKKPQSLGYGVIHFVCCHFSVFMLTNGLSHSLKKPTKQVRG